MNHYDMPASESETYSQVDGRGESDNYEKEGSDETRFTPHIGEDDGDDGQRYTFNNNQQNISKYSSSRQSTIQDNLADDIFSVDNPDYIFNDKNINNNCDDVSYSKVNLEISKATVQIASNEFEDEQIHRLKLFK